MAESLLSVTLSDLRNAVSEFLGFGADYTAITDSNSQARVNRAIKVGLRRFYGVPGHEWSFLRAVGQLVTASGEYRYDLPDDFGEIIDHFAFALNSGYRPIRGPINESRIRGVRGVTNATGIPNVYAIRSKPAAGNSPSRCEVLFDPTPDGVYTLNFAYRKVGQMLDSDHWYPLGGADVAEAQEQCCIAAAEKLYHDGETEEQADAERLLAAAVQLDRKKGPRLLGYNGDGPSEPRMTLGSSTVSYNGVDVDTP